MSTFAPSLFPFLLLAGSSLFAQSTAEGAAAVATKVEGLSISGMLQPALLDVQHAAGTVNTGKWKASNAVKEATDRNVSSIQRDLVETLPGLLTQADGAPKSVPTVFAVYRNIDALYDVVLRVRETAMLASPQGDAPALSSALEKLEAGRKQLAEAIVTSAEEGEVRIAKLQTDLKAATAAPPPVEKPAIVDDGAPAPAAKPAVKRRRRTRAPAAKPPAPASPPPATTPPAK